MRSWQEIAAGFVDPGDVPKRKRGQPIEQWRAAVEDHGWRYYVYRAVHHGDPTFRHYLAAAVSRHIGNEEPLPEPVAEWLIFVLQTLMREDRIPTKHKARPVDREGALQRRKALARFIMEREASKPKEKVIDRLTAAAEALGVSYETVRGTYYDAGFRRWLDVTRSGLSK